MGTQTYIPAQPDNPDSVDMEALLRIPLAIAKTAIRKVRIYLLLNIINMVWIPYFYNAHTDASLLWITPFLLVLTLIIVHQWFLYLSLRKLLQLPAKLNNFNNNASIKTNAFFQQNENIVSRMQGDNPQLADVMQLFGSFSSTHGATNEFQEIMSSVVRAMLLGNPVFLGLSIGLSSLGLFGGFILLTIHIVDLAVLL